MKNFSVIREVLQDMRDMETAEENEQATITGSVTPTQAQFALDAIEAELERYRAAMEKVIEFNLQHAKDMCGDATKAEAWACVRTLREALRD